MIVKKIVLGFLILLASLAYSQEKQQDTIPVPKWKIRGSVAFIFNQSSFSNWSSGGENTVAGNININYDFNYKQDNINWDSKIISGYGLSYLGGRGYRKTNDRLEVNSLLGIKTTNYWFLSFIGNFRTQYTNGFDYSKEPKAVVSGFFSLGTVLYVSIFMG